jgi:glycerol-3-phosphate acyltransferase PlsY
VFSLGFAGIEYFLPWIILGYLMGSCPTGFILVRMLKGEDIRRFGSGNIGATNVSRVLGKGWAVFTAAADMFKGGAAILITMLCGYNDPALLSFVGAAGVIGHNYPVWIGFRGGKGVATSFGVIACFDFFNPAPAILGGVVWFIAREVTCAVSAASMAALGASALFIYFFGLPGAYFKCGLFLFVFSMLMHRENIKRLMNGGENKVKPFFPRREEHAGKSS